MNPMLKSILVISVKQAVNALIVNGVFNTFMGNWHQLTTRQGLINAGWLTLSTVLAREVMVWGPKVLAWSQSSSDAMAAAGGK